MITLYHNPRCSKSRECNLHLESHDGEVEVINYIETPFTEESLTQLIDILDIKSIELVRANEPFWKENYLGKKLSS